MNRQDTPIYIYVLELEDKYFFIHRATDKFPLQIMIEFEIYYDFVKEHKPKQLLEKILETDLFQLDATVKRYMYERGYNYVRGGSYTDIILSKETEKYLLNELENAEKEYPDHQESYQYLVDKYFCKNWENSDLLKEHETVLENIAKYEAEKAKNDEFQDIRRISMNYVNVEDIEWIRSYCKKVIEDTMTTQRTMQDDFIINKDKSAIQKYKKTLCILEHVYKHYTRITATSNENINVEYKHPRFLLDKFFYHPHKTHMANIQPKLDEFCDSFRYFIQFVVNRMDECAFDVSSWGVYDVEWRNSRSIYMLEILKKYI